MMIENPGALNDRVTDLACLRCEARFPTHDRAADRGIGCPTCLQKGYPASLKVAYGGPPDFSRDSEPIGMAAFSRQLPYEDFPSLGEGSTPLIELPGIAGELEIDRLWVKNEGANPTGSHKDRMSPLVVARALDLGRDTVIAASSGNAGASLAAYAQCAGLHCVIVSTPDITPLWAQAITMTGADLIIQETPKDRWIYMEEKVGESGWYPATNFLDPPVGSNPFGVQGYKTAAFEILAAMGEQPPSVLIVPTARGDLLWGLYEGMAELASAGRIGKPPRLISVEPVPRLSRVLAGTDYRRSFTGMTHDMVSIGGTTATYQSLVALRGTEGTAVEVSNAAARKAQRKLAKTGFYAELSAAASLAGLWKAIDLQLIQPDDRVVLLLTSHGYKEKVSS